MAEQPYTEPPQEGQLQRHEREEREANAQLEDALDAQDEQSEDDEGYFEGENGDVELHAPEVDVDEIELDVDRLDAHLSLDVHLAELLHIRAGLDLTIDDVHLEMRGVETGTHLQVNLDKIQQILNRAFEAIEQNPEVYREALTGARSAAGQASGASSGSGGEKKNLSERLKEMGAVARAKTQEALGDSGKATAENDSGSREKR